MNSALLAWLREVEAGRLTGDFEGLHELVMIREDERASAAELLRLIETYPAMHEQLAGTVNYDEGVDLARELTTQVS